MYIRKNGLVAVAVVAMAACDDAEVKPGFAVPDGAVSAPVSRYAEAPPPPGMPEDGIYVAEVDYYDPKTGDSEVYDLEVNVLDGAVDRITFPGGESLPAWRLSSRELDAERCASVEDDAGRKFEVCLQ